jgi:autotransporter translocation and assembly factor TamB
LFGTDLDIGGQAFKSLMIKGRSSADKIYWDTLMLAVEKDQQLTSQGWYAFDRRFALSMAAENIGLRHVAALQRAYPVDGRLGLRLKATGSIDAPQLDADLIIRDPHLNDQPWDDFHMTAQMRERRLKLAADLNFNLTADYRIDNGDFDLEADFDRSDLSPYLALWAGADWAGMLSGRLRAKGNRHQPNQIQADLSLKDTELSYQNQSIISAQQLKAHLANGQLELPSTRIELLNNGFIDLTAAGRLPTDLRMSAQGLLPLAALTPFVKSLEEPHGELTFKVGAQGPLDEMQWQAKLDFNNTGFEIPGLSRQVESLKGHLEITPGRILVEDISGRVDGGRFTLNGQLPLEQWQPIGGQLILNAHALPLQWPDTMDVVVSGDLTFKGAKETPALSGQLVLLEGSYYKDVKLNLLSAVTQTKRAVPVSSSYSVPGKLGRISLDVAVTHRYPLLVDNNMANLQIAPDLKISGTPAHPILSGRAQVKEGEVIFRRKSFEVKRGVVDFINPYKIEPNLDIVAETDIRQWQVSLSLSGTPNQLVFKLSSNPAESENDILSLILLGRTGSELAKGEGGSKQTTRQMLASLVATAWGEDVKKHSGIDILEVETDTDEDEDEENADRVQLTVGKKLSRRLTVKYEVESGQEELVQRAISEYRFLEHLLASGFQDSKGGYGGELVFRVEF